MTASVGIAPGETASREDFCPYLGLADDPATHYAFPSVGQRCHATSRPTTIDDAKQARDCLTVQFPTCSRYHPPAPGPLLSPSPPSSTEEALTLERVSVGTIVARGRSSVRVSGRWWPALIASLFAAAVLVGLLVGSLLGSQSGVGSGSGGQGAGGSSQPAAGRASASPVASMPPSSARPSPSPSPSSSPSPTPTPTATPTPVPTAQVHVVERGETLTQIARQYGVTLAALEAANGIKDPNLIVVGQKLKIPLP